MNPVRATVEIGPQAGTATGALVLFWVFAVIAVAGALATVTRRNAVTAVVCLVGTFFAIAAEFLLLYAQFLAVIQVLVYAGAIMVLFVFVVMVVSRGEADPLWKLQGPVTKTVAVVAMGTLLWRGWHALRTFQPARIDAPPSGFGTVGGVGQVLLGDFLFPFEAISILLLVAVVGALVIARHHHDKDKAAQP